MIYRELGKTGMKVSVLGFGGAEIGFQKVPQDDVNTLLNAALDAGLNVIDTAECYIDSEEKIGKAVGNRRKDYFLFTKCGHSEGWSDPDWESPERLMASIDRSLKRLKTDTVDLVQLHSCSLEYLKKGVVIEVLEKARAAGKTRFIGYSGDDQAARYAVECGRFDTLQTSVSMADQQSVDLTLPLALEKGIGVIAKRPIANAAWKYKERPKGEYAEIYWERLQQLKYPFVKGDGDPAEIALRFTLSVLEGRGVQTAIVGTTKPGRWQENATLADKGLLPREQMDAIQGRWKAVAGTNWVGQG